MSEDQPRVIRLSVNLAPDVAEALKGWAAWHGVNITEAIRRSIATWNFLETERALGNRIAVIERDGEVDRVREVEMVDGSGK